MSTKFEQLLDLIVNEEMDKANELFHEIVVEKSRDIYENLIAEEADDEEMDESADDDEEMDESADDEEMDESADDDEEMDESADEDTDESVDLEDSYGMESDPRDEAMGGDAADKFGADIDADDNMDDKGGSEESAIFDIKNAIAELEAAFADLEAAQGGDMGGDEFDDSGDDMDGDEEPMKMGFQEGRRMTREYTETVGTNWDKGSTMKAQGQYVGSGSGDKESAPVEGRSPVSSGSGKPTSGANAKNLAQSHTEGGTDKGTSPGKVNKGINPESSEKFARGANNVDGGRSGVKTLTPVKGGHGAEKRGAGPGPVGSGTGDKAGQTSIAKIPQFLKKL